MTMRIAGRHAIDLRDANGVRRSTYKARKYRGHRMAIETIFTCDGAIADGRCENSQPVTQDALFTQESKKSKYSTITQANRAKINMAAITCIPFLNVNR